MPTHTVVLDRLSRWFRLGWIDSLADAPRKFLLPIASDAALDAELDRMFGAVPAGHPASTGIHQKPMNQV
jgi:hypothetical protein